MAHIDEIRLHIGAQHQGTWHKTLNNHASTPPKTYGGPLCRSVTEQKTFEHLGPGSASPWRCSLRLPNSFAPGDGVEVVVSGQGATKKDASEDACQIAIAMLLSEDPSKVVLRPDHWKVSPDELIAELPGRQGEHQALPVHEQRRRQHAGEEVDSMSLRSRTEEIAELIRLCLHTHGGSFDPARISSKKTGRLPAGTQDPTTVQQRLNRLLRPNELRPFIEAHPEFTWTQHGEKGMLVTWAEAQPSDEVPNPSDLDEDDLDEDDPYVREFRAHMWGPASAAAATPGSASGTAAVPPTPRPERSTVLACLCVFQTLRDKIGY